MKTILIVDDDELQAALAQDCLTCCPAATGITVRLAHSKQQALEVAEGLDDFIVITDMELGDGTGLEVRDALQGRAPVHVMSCSLQGRRQQEGIRQKPMDIGEQIRLLDGLVAAWTEPLAAQLK